MVYIAVALVVFKVTQFVRHFVGFVEMRGHRVRCTWAFMVGLSALEPVDRGSGTGLVHRRSGPRRVTTQV